MRSGARVAAGAGWPVLDRKGTKAAQFDAVALRHRAGDLTEDRVDDILNVALIKVRILGRNALDEF